MVELFQPHYEDFSCNNILDLVQEKLKGKTILYVEDVAFVRKQYIAFLERIGDTVIVASDGIEGVQKFKENNIDIILLDIGLPRMDGITMLEEIRKLPGGMVPAIAMTAYDDDIDVLKRFIGAGGGQYLTKPVDPWLLLNALLAAA